MMRVSHRLLGRCGALATVSAIFLLSACGGDQSTLAPLGDNARLINNLFGPIFWVAVAVFVIVEGLLLYAVYRYRYRPGDTRTASQTHGNTRLEIGWTIAPAIVVTIIFGYTLNTQRQLTNPPPSDSALNVEVIGHQWWWEFRYPDLAPAVVTANELHIPVGEVIQLKITSVDVIHSFWVPRLAGKQDAVPGHVNPMWMRADEPGAFRGQCAELCGIQHALMGLRVIAQSPDEFQAWVTQQQAPAPAPAAAVARGAQLFAQGACVGCHTIAGTPGKGTTGPNLTHVGSRTTLASGFLENTPENLVRWLRNPQALKEGVLMPNLNLSNEDASALAAYLQSLK